MHSTITPGNRAFGVRVLLSSVMVPLIADVALLTALLAVSDELLPQPVRINEDAKALARNNLGAVPDN